MELIDHKPITKYLNILKYLEYENPDGKGSTQGERLAVIDFRHQVDKFFGTSINEVKYLRLSKTYTQVFPRIKEELREETENLISSKKKRLLVENHRSKLKGFKKNYKQTLNPKLVKAFFDYYKSYLKGILESSGKSYEEYISKSLSKLPDDILECRKLMEYFLEKMWENGDIKHFPNLFTLYKHLLIRERTLLKYLQLQHKK